MRGLVALMARAKGRDITLDPNVTSGYLVGLVAEKGASLLRGLLRTRRAVFLGRGTRVRAPGQLKAAKGAEIGAFCEIDCLSRHGLTIGRSSKIGSHSIVKVSGTLSDLGDSIVIGNDVGIGDFAHIGGAGPVRIGDNTITGSYLSIHPENHVFDQPGVPIRLQGVTRAGITIGRDCWLGAKVTILDGVTIGDGCVIAAGAVVTQSFPDRVVIGGVPARVLKSLESPES